MAGGMAKAQPPPSAADERVPLFGTWPRIYAAVIVSALAVMALVAVFSTYPY
jgi:hypothetical protein